MLKKEVITKLAALLKIDEKLFTEALTAPDEKELTLPDLQLFTPEELTSRDDAKLAEGKKIGLKEGEGAGKELTVKELKKVFGVEFEGKDAAKLVEMVKGQFAKGDEGLKQQLETLRQQMKDKDKTIEQIEQQAAQATFDAQLLSSFPANRKSVNDGGFTDAEYLAAIKANLQFETVDGATVVKKGGQIVQDQKTYKPLAVPDVVQSYFGERKWSGEQQQQQQGGRGGGNQGNGGGKPIKLSEAMKAWEADGKSTATAEFQTHVTALVKENKDFEFDTVQ